MKSLTPKTIVSVLACVFLSAGVSIGCSSTPDRADRPVRERVNPATTASAQELFIQGNKALDEKDFEGAIALYDKALEIDQARWDIHMNKAIAHSAVQQFTKAVSAIDQALANGGEREAQVYFNLGNIYQNRGLYAQSVKAYRTALAVSDEPDIDALVNLGAGLTLMREYDKARQTYQHLQTLAPDDPRVYVGLGLVAHSEQNHQQALEQYDAAIRAEPTYAQVWFNKAKVHHELEQFGQASESYRRYVELAPEGPHAKRARSRIKALEAKK